MQTARLAYPKKVRSHSRPAFPWWFEKIIPAVTGEGNDLHTLVEVNWDREQATDFHTGHASLTLENGQAINRFSDDLAVIPVHPDQVLEGRAYTETFKFAGGGVSLACDTSTPGRDDGVSPGRLLVGCLAHRANQPVTAGRRGLEAPRRTIG